MAKMRSAAVAINRHGRWLLPSYRCPFSGRVFAQYRRGRSGLFITLASTADGPVSCVEIILCEKRVRMPAVCANTKRVRTTASSSDVGRLRMKTKTRSDLASPPPCPPRLSPPPPTPKTTKFASGVPPPSRLQRNCRRIYQFPYFIPTATGPLYVCAKRGHSSRSSGRPQPNLTQPHPSPTDGNVTF